MGIFKRFPTQLKSILKSFHCLHAFHCYAMNMFRITYLSMMLFHDNSTATLQITVSHVISYIYFSTLMHPFSQSVHAQRKLILRNLISDWTKLWITLDMLTYISHLTIIFSDRTVSGGIRTWFLKMWTFSVWLSNRSQEGRGSIVAALVSKTNKQTNKKNETK